MQESGASTTKSSALSGTILLAGGLAALAAVLIFFIITAFADKTALLLPGMLDDWRERWSREGPRDYDLSINIQVDRQDESRAETKVRDGKLVSQTYNGLPRASSDDSYTIAGLFRTMERELELQAKQKGDTVLKAEFDQKLGAPVVFKRLTTRPGGRSVVINVIELSSPKAGTLFPAEQPGQTKDRDGQ